jgi:transcriptional regulator with XRE-family HTH domain
MRHEQDTGKVSKGDLRKRLGAGIVQARESRKWSQVELARRLEVSRDRLGKWERGLNEPGLEDLARLSEVLGLPLSELGLGEPPAESLAARELMALARQLLAMSRPLRPWLERVRKDSLRKR